jgi:hypothetical protein
MSIALPFSVSSGDRFINPGIPHITGDIIQLIIPTGRLTRSIDTEIIFTGISIRTTITNTFRIAIITILMISIPETAGMIMDRNILINHSRTGTMEQKTVWISIKTVDQGGKTYRNTTGTKNLQIRKKEDTAATDHSKQMKKRHLFR